MNSQGQSQPKNITHSYSPKIIGRALINLFVVLTISVVSAEPSKAQETTQKSTNQEVKVQDKVQTEVSNTASILENVQSFYASAADFKADFRQTYTYKIYGRKKVSTGTVYFKKPAKMRWDYEAPTKRVFVADGETLWVYEPEEAQVFKRALSSAQLPIALRFMRGDAKLDQEFDVKGVEKSAELVKLSLAPKSPSPDFDILELSVDQENGQVRSSTLVDPSGNTNRIDFVAIQINQDLPNSGFSFTPPEGVRVIDEESSR